jgi:transcriptional regulator with XRE-family HTH domain
VLQESLAARLKAFREAKGLTKYRLAKISGVSETYLYRIERGLIENPRRDTLQRLAQGLSITLAQLVGDTAPSETWQLVEQSLKAYIPVYAGIYEVGMNPVDYVVCTRVEVPPKTVRGYRIQGLCLGPDIQEGDTLIVDSALVPANSDLLLIVASGQPAIGRYHKDEDGTKWLQNNEGRYAWDSVSICGVITEYVRKLR